MGVPAGTLFLGGEEEALFVAAELVRDEDLGFGTVGTEVLILGRRELRAAALDKLGRVLGFEFSRRGVGLEEDASDLDLLAAFRGWSWCGCRPCVIWS